MFSGETPLATRLGELVAHEQSLEENPYGEPQEEEVLHDLAHAIQLMKSAMANCHAPTSIDRRWASCHVPCATPRRVEEQQLSKTQTFMTDLANTTVKLCTSTEQQCFKMVNSMRDELQKEMRETMAEMAQAPAISTSQIESEVHGMVSTILEPMMDQVDMASGIMQRQDECIYKVMAEMQQMRIELDELNLRVDGPFARAVSEETNQDDSIYNIRVETQQMRALLQLQVELQQQMRSELDEVNETIATPAGSFTKQLHQQYDHRHDDSISGLERLKQAISDVGENRKSGADEWRNSVQRKVASSPSSKTGSSDPYGGSTGSEGTVPNSGVVTPDSGECSLDLE